MSAGGIMLIFFVVAVAGILAASCVVAIVRTLVSEWIDKKGGD